MRKTLPAAQRILGSSHEFTLRVMGCYAEALYLDTGATRSDLREAVTTLEDAAQIVRRVLSVAFTRSQKGLWNICKKREQRSAPARRRRGVRNLMPHHPVA